MTEQTKPRVLMDIPKGEIIYETKPDSSQRDRADVNGIGFAYSPEDASKALRAVKARLAIVTDWGELRSDLESKTRESGFGDEDFPISAPRKDEIGELLATVYLRDYRGYLFPWISRFDKKCSEASLPGADLVGFYQDDNPEMLAFGEAKTSAQDRYPPSVVDGQTGLISQLQKLNDSRKKRRELAIYLYYRTKGSPPDKQHIPAIIAILKGDKFRLCGFLVRDVKPDERDVRRCVRRLDQDNAKNTRIEIFVLYLPPGSIDKLESGMQAISEGQL